MLVDEAKATAHATVFSCTHCGSGSPLPQRCLEDLLRENARLREELRQLLVDYLALKTAALRLEECLRPLTPLPTGTQDGCL
jgi:hypothetical protein